MGDSRTANTKRNLYWGMAAKAVGLLLPFLTRSVMIYTLGMRYVGLDSLFKSLLEVLSFAELGFGGALVFSMYKPMAEHDVKRVNALLAFYRKCYRVIGTVILVLGLCMTPFLDIFVNGDVPPEVNLKALFLIQLMNTVTGYFMFAYRSSIFQAQQRVDISQKVTLTLNAAANLARICILLASANYYVYIIVGPVVTIIQNLTVAYLAKKKYPEYYCKGEISGDERKEIQNKVYGLMFQKIGNIVLFSVDTVVISSFLGLETLGIYNGYYYVITALVGFIGVIQSAMIPSLGNSVVMESKEKNYYDFRKFHFLIIWLLTWWSACLLCLFQPFMTLWQGQENLLPFGMVVLFCFYFYLHHAGDIVYMYREATGIWWQGRYCALLAASVNLTLNLILVQVMGLPGVVLSTVIALVTVNIPYGAKVLFQYYFESSKRYYMYLRRMAVYFIAAVIISGITYGICQLVSTGDFWKDVIIAGCVCAVLPNVLFVIIYWKLNDFQSVFKKIGELRMERREKEKVDELKKDCNGCAVCGDICPAGAIYFREDMLTGFWYPALDREKCIECGECEAKCPQKNPVERKVRSEPEVKAAWSKRDEVRLMCSSGGIFYEIASSVIAQKGAVIACSYTEDFRGAFHKTAVNQEELLPLCGSKYVQSDTVGIYKKTKELLESYPLVLFVGAPCQIAALYRFFEGGGELEKLLTVDFICNSVNSPKSQAKYIDYLEEAYGSKLVYARAKDKRNGWTNFGSSARFANGKEYYAGVESDAREVAYHDGHLFIRESCQCCQYKKLPRNADITLGDFWGIERDARNPGMELGTSAVMANSEKGVRFMEQLKPAIEYYEKTLEDVLRGNPALVQSMKADRNSYKAFKALDSMRFDYVVDRYRGRNGRKQRMLRRVKKIVKTLLYS